MDNLNADNRDKSNKDDDNYILSGEKIKLLAQRKADFISGNTSSRPWNEIKQEYEIK